MDHWVTLVLNGYSCEDFPPRTIQSCLLLRKHKVRPNIWTENPQDLSLWKSPACQTLKPLDISIATVGVAPDVVKAIAILSSTTARKSAVDREDHKPHWKSD